MQMVDDIETGKVKTYPIDEVFDILKNELISEDDDKTNQD
jgi:hypothetical protein